MVSARAPLPPADPAVPSRSALSAGPAFLGPERATPRRGHRPEGARGPTRAASSEGSGSRLKLSVNQVGTGAVPREASELPGQADPAALQARLPLGVLRTRGPGRRGLFCSRTGGGGGRGQHSAWRAGPEPPRARPALERSGPEGRSRAAPTHLPFQLHRSLEYCAPAPPSSTARSSSSGGGGGPGAGGLGHSCPERPPAAQAAPRMLWLRLCRRPRVRASPSRPSTRRGRAPSPGGHVARPGRPESGRPPIPSGAGAARAAGAAAAPRTSAPAAAACASEVRDSTSQPRLSWGAVPARPPRPRPGPPPRAGTPPRAPALAPGAPGLDAAVAEPAARRGQRAPRACGRLGRRAEERAARGTGRRVRERRARLDGGVPGGRGSGSSASLACAVRAAQKPETPSLCRPKPACRAAPQGQCCGPVMQTEPGMASGLQRSLCDLPSELLLAPTLCRI